MTIYDAVMAIVVVLGMVRGAWRGFTWQMASIASLVLGYTAAHSGSAQFASYLPGEPEVQRVLAMAVIYIVVSGGIFGIAWMIRGTLRKLKIEAYDRHLGMLLGGLEGVGVGMLATMFVVSVAPAARQPIFSSPTGRVVGTVMSSLGPVLPIEVRKVLAPHWYGDASSTEAVADVDTTSGSAGSVDPANEGAAAAVVPALPPLHEAAAPGDPAASDAELPALPPLEAPPGNDAAVQAARGARSVAKNLANIVVQGRREVEQAVVETLDGHPDPKATNLRQLMSEDKQWIKGAIQNVKTGKQKAAGQVKDRLSKGRQQLEQAITDSISKGQEQIEQTISDSIDQQLRRVGGLESAPQARPK
jgi:membrane protein required for colicin V production